ncbi:putative N-acetylated-alpha-linked acidic dipeptidase isoform X1 [Haliotis asinina]|uniref:putative N-acetylated-alpha-linked acidic dipeptidase isoform X1 n=2 Tax=Haliotis asinina TaxID=109174 RepID=UPI003531F276
MLFAELMPTRGYIAGKPVSRWDAESDNIDIEYKNLDRPRPQAWCGDCFSGRKGTILKVLLLIVIFFVGLILGYIIRRNIHETFIAPEQKPNFGVQQDYSPEISKVMRDSINNVANYQDHIKTITRKILLSGLGGTNQMIDYVDSFWKAYYFNSLREKKYSVQLSYPQYDKDTVSELRVVDSNNTVYFHYHNNMTNEKVEYLPFNAYAKSGNITSDLVYAHYGRSEDFQKLKDLKVNITGCILLIRYGRIHPANKVKHAEEYGASGVVLYSDPQDFSDPHAEVGSFYYLRSWAIQLAQVRYALTGDPTTPQYSSLGGVPRVTTNNSNFPNIPVLPISYGDAQDLLKDLGGVAVPSEWRGDMNVTYKTGPGYIGSRHDSKVNLIVNNVLDMREVTNIIGTFKGKYEEDHYILVGAHIDTWTMGAVDAGSGFAVLMELVRVYSYQVKNGWKPRRSVIFAVWDASKYGHIGAYEWVQEYEKQLGYGAVTYINLDSAVRGNYSFYAEASPLLYDVIYDATMTVSLDGTPVYNSWKTLLPGMKDKNRPLINDLVGDSDASPFAYHVGVPSIAPAFTYDIKTHPNLPTYPAYSTLEDDSDYLKTLIDPDFKLHITLTQIVTDLLLRLSDSAILPFNVSNYELIFRKGKMELDPYMGDIDSAQIRIDVLYAAIQNFTDSAHIFQKRFTSIDKTKITEFALHKMNDQVIQLSRAFIAQQGFPGHPQYRNVLVSPHPENLNDETVFPGLIWGAIEGRRTGNWDMFRHQLSVLLVCFRQARDILTEDIISATL